MTKELFFADTYALVEIIKGNPNYGPYLAELLVTSALNVAELYYWLLLNFGEERAEHYFMFYAGIMIPASLPAIRNGMLMRIKFLTGDEKFRNKANVEFVK
ncbi:hypothetical protein HYV85_00380 [Candidatus Woesearchaeota archaeon]|nr:hypothetical protein [Candidatus Woesearchaeota archaeon]